MALPAVAGNSIYASDLYQLCQPSGGQEKGKYWLEGNSYASGADITYYLSSQSRNATPVSVSIDTADRVPTTNLNAPAAANLTASGFHISASTTATSLNEFCGGNYTIQF